MLICIVVQYKPISNLAGELKESAEGGKKGVVDEGSLLSSRFAALKDDSDQKQHFEMAYHEAEAANKAKSAFLSSMSHDIRTPMNAIVGMTAIASKRLDDPEYVGQCLKKVEVASQYLLDIINNVLDMSRIESGRVTLLEETVELPKLVHDLITILNQSVEAKKQQLVVEAESIENEHVTGDSVRLMQVFMNILSNAVKFTPEGGKISLHMRQLPETEQGWGDYVFTFSDNGIGMTQEFVGQVFDTFSRAGGAKVEGTGLGMAIAKNLIELMGGSIACRSELGKGTTFTVRLHMRLVLRGSETADRDHSAMTALVVCGENCEDQLRTIAETGARAERAKNAAEAAELLKLGGQYRVVIINQSPGDRNGIAAMAEIASIAGEQDTEYVLAVNGLTDIRQSDAKEAGIAAIVQLPLFKSTVRFILDRSYYDAPNIAKRASKTALDLTGKRALVVEDNNMNRVVARRILSEAKLAIEEATDGRQAVELFAAKPEGYYDLILMDLQMPVMNGYEATTAIRALERSDAAMVPIYALTANTFDEDVRQVREAGMNGHIGKPYTPEALFRLLYQVFGAQQG